MNFKRMSIITALAVAQASTVMPVSAQSSAIVVPGQVVVQPEAENSGNVEQQQSQEMVQPSESASEPAANQLLTPGNTSSEEESSSEKNAEPDLDPSLKDPASSENQASGKTDEMKSQSDSTRESATEEQEKDNDVEQEKPEDQQSAPTHLLQSSAVSTSSSNELVLMMNSANMYHNGKHYKAAQPMAVKKGVSYVSIRAMVERVGLEFSYNNTTKETIVIKDGNELRFKADSSTYKVNGESRKMKGAAYNYKGTFMVPLTAITQALDIPYKVNQAEKKVILDLSGISNSDHGSDPEEGSTAPQPPINQEPGLVLMMNSADMYHNGKYYKAAQPMAVKNGVSYVAIRSLVDRIGLQLTYNSKTKETIIMRGADELRFKTDSKYYTVNGVKTAMKGAAYQTNNTFMVPLTSITQALGIPYRVDNKNKRIILNLGTKPVASFTVTNDKIFAGETTVKYKTNAYSPTGLQIVNERWEGREEIFSEPGIHTITYYVQDSSGEWSDPYSVTIEVMVPNEPPVAMFTTDKEEYKMGEKITYIDQSTDDENAIVNRDWDNNALAFFTPGPVKVGLTVTDKHGAKSYYEKTIIITGETLYSREEFYQLFAPVGEEYYFDGSKVPSMNLIPINRTSDSRTLIRSNSPETVYTEGVVYRETVEGDVRFMIHHLNATGRKVKMHVVATNKSSSTATLTTEHVGFGGPSNIPTATGKAAVQRYLESIQSGEDYELTRLKPGESKVILKDLSAQAIQNGQVVTMFADLYSDAPIQYDIVLIEQSKDPIHKLPYLRLHPTDGVHNRGTYEDSTIYIESNELIGSTPGRLAIGDKTHDPNLIGYDGITGYETTNAGNFGVLYHIKLNRVAPNTLISLNPRGGKYMGVVMVNGHIIGAPSIGASTAPNEATILYRTGKYEQSIEIVFTAAPGSSLPINFLFTPLPELKTN
ncbi:copper amine oxidase N-terminal domain-containing protein [Paenibacillus faecalis]|uniref:copper amine oxidase N-terminal domain-containing protein n=1 Tax=Paenibacillus faecalis TaxID=2079532 RepID=UPI000D105E5A|nr:stalk domain-containing protein [Paenibacillus faecalis]